MDFDFSVVAAVGFALVAFVELVVIRKLIQKLSDKVDVLSDIVTNAQDQVKEVTRIATTAKQVSLNAWDDAKKRHTEIISAIQKTEQPPCHNEDLPGDAGT